MLSPKDVVIMSVYCMLNDFTVTRISYSKFCFFILAPSSKAVKEEPKESETEKSEDTSTVKQTDKKP